MGDNKEQLRNAIEALLQDYYDINELGGIISFQCGIENGRAYCEDF